MSKLNVPTSQRPPPFSGKPSLFAEWIRSWVFACLFYSFTGLPKGPRHVTGLGASAEAVTAGWKDADSSVWGQAWRMVRDQMEPGPQETLAWERQHGESWRTEDSRVPT